MPNNTSSRHKTVRACTLLDNHADEIESLFPEILYLLNNSGIVEGRMEAGAGDPTAALKHF